MTTKHTPGPWYVGETIKAEAMCIVGDGDSVVCEFPDRLGATVDADARLIAAAPDLLEALRAVLDCGSAIHEPAYMAGRAAIAKATGEQA